MVSFDCLHSVIERVGTKHYNEIRLSNKEYWEASPIIEVIRKRKSVRTYTGEDLKEEILINIDKILKNYIRGPFGNEIRFVLLDFKDMKKDDIKLPGTYGIIRGAKLFIAGAVVDAPGVMEDFGYCMERVILALTEMGLGTCWMAGTFQRSAFARKLDLAENELFPAITPVGYSKDKMSLVDRSFRVLAGSDNRKKWEELFFLNDTNTPLQKSDVGDYLEIIESVRLGPSASNRQPWRIIKEKDRNVFHLYLQRTKGYPGKKSKVKLQNLDMGIAVCHFELAAAEKGKQGKWLNNRPALEAGEMEYILSWHED